MYQTYKVNCFKLCIHCLGKGLTFKTFNLYRHSKGIKTDVQEIECMKCKGTGQTKI